MAIKKWVNGNITVTADTTEVYPHDPGNGAPIMVDHRNGCCATMPCALDQGVLDGDQRAVVLGNSTLRWLSEIQDQATQWLRDQGCDF